MNYSPLIYAYEQENIAITGTGTFDGQAGQKHWWPWKGKSGSGPNQTANRIAAANGRGQRAGQQSASSATAITCGRTSCSRTAARTCSSKASRSPTRRCGFSTPCSARTSPIRGVTVDSHGPNSDGCDPESCRDVLIENCTFDTGDDCIAIKSGRNADGRRIGVPSENIIVRGCTMKDGHGGVVLGSEMSGGIRNVFVEDCAMDSPNLDRAIRLKSNSLRGGYLENLFVRNVRVGQVKEAVVRINLQYDKDRGEHYPTVRNIHIENVTSNKSGRPFYFVGLENAKIENVVIENCTFKNAAKPSVFEHVDQVTLRNFRLLPREGLDDD